MLTKSKSTLLKSIAMIVTLIMVVCVCLTACADQTARDTAKEAKEIAEKAQSSLDDSLKDYVKKDEVAKMIEDALNKFMTGDGLTMVTNAMKSEAGSKIISDAVSSAIDSKLEGLQDEEQVKKLINDALTAPDSALNTAITNALSGYMTEESAKTLVNDALDAFLKDKINGDDGAIKKALDDYKSVVSGLVEEKIGTDVSTYLKSEEAQQLIADCFSKYEKDGVKNAVESAAKIVALQNIVLNNHWTAADKTALTESYNTYIVPLFVDEGNDLDATGETKIVRLLYLINTCDQATLKASVAEFEKTVTSRESLEQAAAKVDAKIADLGINIDGIAPDAYVNARTIEFTTEDGKLGFVIAMTDDGHVYFKSGSYAKLVAFENAARGFDMAVEHADENENYFYTIDENGDSIPVKALIAPVLSDTEKIAEIKADLKAILEKFGEDYPELKTTIPGKEDDKRTEEDESTPDQVVFNTAAIIDGVMVLKNHSFLADYEDILNTIQKSADDTLAAINQFYALAGENGENITKDAKNWASYKAAVENYQLYEDSRYDNVIDGVKEAYDAFIKFVDEKVAAAIKSDEEAQIEAWKAAYQEKVDVLFAAYWAKANAKIADILAFVAVYQSPIYAHPYSPDESKELMDWAHDYCDNYKETMKPDFVSAKDTIKDEQTYQLAMNDLDAQFEDFMNDLDHLIDGPVVKALNEIDAKYWFETVRKQQADRVAAVLDNTSYNIKGWDVGDAKDIYHIALAYVNKKVEEIKNYQIDATSDTPYTKGVDFMQSVLKDDAAIKEAFEFMEKWFDTRYSVFTDPATLDSTVDRDLLKVEKYVGYKAYVLNLLAVEYADLLQNNYDSNTWQDKYEFEHYLEDFKKVYDAQVAALQGVQVSGDDYKAAIEALDAQYAASVRALNKEVYRMLIERKMVEVDQHVTQILQDFYQNDANAALYQKYYVQLLEIVNKYHNEIIPSHTLENSYIDADKADDLAAYNNAIALIEKEYDNCKRDLAKSCYISMLADALDKLAKDVNKYHAETILDEDGVAYEDTYELFALLKAQIDALIDTDANLSIADDVVSADAYISEFKAAYEAKLQALNEAVDAYKTMLDDAIMYTSLINDLKVSAPVQADNLFNDVFGSYAAYDYKNTLKSDLTVVKRKIGDVVIKRPSHIETDAEGKETVVYDDFTSENLEAAYNEAETAINKLFTDYSNNLTNYVAEMEAYKQAISKLEDKKRVLTAQIERFLQYYTGASEGRFVDSDPETWWGADPDVFEKNSPVELGLRAALKALEEVKLVMNKGVAEDGTKLYYTADEALHNAMDAAVLDAEGNVTTEGGALWTVLKNTVVDEPNETNFLVALNRLLGYASRV